MTDNDWKNVEMWLEAILTEYSDKLNEWETNFVNDMDIKFQNSHHAGFELSQAQLDKLEQIYNKYNK